MGIIDCSECKNRISNKAKKCPNCGAPVNSFLNNLDNFGKTLRDIGKILTLFVTIPILLMLLLMFC